MPLTPIIATAPNDPYIFSYLAYQVVAASPNGDMFFITSEDFSYRLLQRSLSGSQLGSPVDIATGLTGGVVGRPAIATFATSGGVIAVASASGPSDTNIYVQRFNANGAIVRTDAIDLDATYSGHDPVVTTFADGSYGVAYRTTGAGAPNDILYRRVSSTGVVGPATSLRNETTDVADDVQLATLTNGNVIAIFTDEASGDVNNHDIRWTIVTPTGLKTTGFIASTATNEYDAQVVAMANGGFVVVWTDASGDSSGAGIRATMFQADGTPVAGATNIAVNTTETGEQLQPSVAAMADGGFMIVWTSGLDLVAQRFGPGGAKLGTEVFFHQHPNLSYHNPDLALMADGRVAVVMGRFDGIHYWDTEVKFLDVRDGPIINGTPNDDPISSLPGGATINGLNGNDRIYGLEGVDILNGNDGNDYLNGGAGNDIMTGGLGNDVYVIDSTVDVVNEAVGQGTQDYVWGTVNVRLDTMTSAVGVEHIVLQGTGNISGIGHNTFNTITGNSANNYLAGNGGNDALNGNAGNDTVYGGEGKDTLTGGLGNDRFYYNFIADSGGTQPRRDVITDFSQIAGNDDWIDLSVADANGALAGNQAFVWLGTGAFTGAAGELRYFQDVANNRTIIEGQVRVDAASPGLEFSLELTGLKTLTAGANNTFDIIL